MTQCTVLAVSPLAVHSPYNQDFARMARLSGGTWDRFRKVWEFARGYTAESLAALCAQFYENVVVADAIPVPAPVVDAGHVGTVGAPLTVEVTIERVISNVGSFGANLHKMRDAAGHVFTWFASSVSLEAGKRYRVTGKIKKHDSYQGVSQTVLTRCKATPIPEVVLLNPLSQEGPLSSNDL